MENPYLDRYRQTHLREVQLKMLSILEEIVRICERHDIPYWLDGGTLLGAARHGGFIPWDDDLDISMRREDLERFIEVAPRELPPHLVLQTPETDAGLPVREYKVRDLNSFYVDGDDDNHATYQKGLFVDIFPFVPYPSRLRGLAAKVTRSMAVTNFRLHALHYYSLRAAAELFYFGVKLQACRLVWRLMQPLCRDGQYTCSIPYYNWYGAVYRTKDLFPLATIAFEGRTFSAPQNVDGYLTSIFRDWRTPPPPEKRKAHAAFFVPYLEPAP